MLGIVTHPKPNCPECGDEMILRYPRPGQDWEPFWGCRNYPECEGSLNIDPETGYPSFSSSWDDLEIGWDDLFGE